MNHVDSRANSHRDRVPLRVQHTLRLRQVQVTRVEDVSPHMRRVTFAGEELAGFTSAAADDHVKLYLPANGENRPTLPMPQPNGGARYPAGGFPPVTRDYTPVRIDLRRCELAVEFVIHGDGPASTWAAQARPGQWIGINGPRGSTLTPSGYDTYLLAGDETALPAIARYLEEMEPGTRTFVFVEVADAGDERHLPTAANATVTWLHRNGQAAGTTDLMEAALRCVTLAPETTYAWVAGEIETARRARRYLTEELGMARHQVRAAGYWRIGEAGLSTKLED